MTDPTTELRKALNATNGAALIPEIVTAGIQEYLEKKSQLYNIIPKVNWDTQFFAERARTALGSSAAFIDDGATLPTAANSTYVKPTWEIKRVAVRGEVTGFEQSVTRNVTDVLREEIMARSDEMVRKIESVIINGDTGSVALEFDGFFKQYTQAVAAGSAALSLNLLDQLLDKPEGGAPTHLVMSRDYGGKLWSLLQAHQGFYGGSVDVGGGFRVPTYADTPIIRMDTGLTGSGGLTTGILAIDTNYCVLAVNKPATYSPLAKTKDSDDFFITSYLVLACRGATRQGAKLTGLAAAGA